ncbi:hypothetical protein GGI11_000938 [Coemansia sp. RSA 2049]|nr:hypothetical protein GGI11_000938 [Coemansia sp. RSA 2049]
MLPTVRPHPPPTGKRFTGYRYEPRPLTHSLHQLPAHAVEIEKLYHRNCTMTCDILQVLHTTMATLKVSSNDGGQTVHVEDVAAALDATMQITLGTLAQIDDARVSNLTTALDIPPIPRRANTRSVLPTYLPPAKPLLVDIEASIARAEAHRDLQRRTQALMRGSGSGSGSEGGRRRRRGRSRGKKRE